ncbi:hypothetical protein OE88DRAFT_1553857 [Heliocybe sulcata]|uniref:Uncharacterized protein n=1 Tax=Heliocybe sulcata TaxID=5364 RepID=A0A5C3N1J0_9AGAM|nr:hypothetical protein OE88DRAFT_1553857 [Heliocybe sulcata]
MLSHKFGALVVSVYLALLVGSSPMPQNVADGDVSVLPGATDDPLANVTTGASPVTNGTVIVGGSDGGDTSNDGTTSDDGQSSGGSIPVDNSADGTTDNGGVSSGSTEGTNTNDGTESTGGSGSTDNSGSSTGSCNCVCPSPNDDSTNAALLSANLNAVGDGSTDPNSTSGASDPNLVDANVNVLPAGSTDPTLVDGDSNEGGSDGDTSGDDPSLAGVQLPQAPPQAQAAEVVTVAWEARPTPQAPLLLLQSVAATQHPLPRRRLLTAAPRVGAPTQPHQTIMAHRLPQLRLQPLATAENRLRARLRPTTAPAPLLPHLLPHQPAMIMALRLPPHLLLQQPATAAHSLRPLPQAAPRPRAQSQALATAPIFLPTVHRLTTSALPLPHLRPQHPATVAMGEWMRPRRPAATVAPLLRAVLTQPPTTTLFHLATALHDSEPTAWSMM